MRFRDAFLVVFLISYSIRSRLAEPTVSLSDSKVYGPGLRSNFTVPVRYFFIHLVDSSNESFPASRDRLIVQVTGLKKKCRIWHQLLNVQDGLFIVRFRLYETCFGLRVDVAFDEQPLSNSPYIVEGIVVPERCYCPRPMSHWLSALGCPAGYHQINEDLSLFHKINMKEAVADVLSRFNLPGAYSICHYAVVTNKVYRKCYGQYVGFSMFMDEILLSIARKAYLPDVEMIVNLGDWPLERREASQNPAPIFSWCGSKSTRDIVMPTYDITEATLEMMGRVMLDIFSVMDNSGPKWEEKKKTAFWRGRDSRQERLDLIKIARQHPDMINASLVNFFFFHKEEAEYGPKTEYISFFDFFKYRYQINIDGTVAAYRMPYLLAGGSLVLKQDSEFYEHFYRELQPMAHYVPIQKNLSDLVDKISWAIEHDDQAQAIADNALEFVLENLLPKDILCYYAVLINEFSKRIDRKPEVAKEMELIEQPAEKSCTCNEHAMKQEMKEEL